MGTDPEIDIWSHSLPVPFQCSICKHSDVLSTIRFSCKTVLVRACSWDYCRGAFCNHLNSSCKVPAMFQNFLDISLGKGIISILPFLKYRLMFCMQKQIQEIVCCPVNIYHMGM